MRKLFFTFEKGKWEFDPGRFFSTIFNFTLLVGILVKWFLPQAWIKTFIESADLGVLALPILGLLGNFAVKSYKKYDLPPEDLNMD